MSLMPYRVRYWTRCFLSRIALRLALRELRRANGRPLPRRTISLLRFGWNNDSFVADVDYLQAVAFEAAETPGNILECGSGLTTILLAALKRDAQTVWVLEHSKEWLDKLDSTLRACGLQDRVDLRYAPLKPRNEFSWYAVGPDFFPTFSLVVCDGPPGVTTLGGRYGLLPVMRKRIAGARILLDDAQRAEEQQAIARWCSEFGVTVEHDGDFCSLLVPQWLD